MKRVPDEVELHFLVERAICAEGGEVIDFNEPRLQLVVYHDVHAEDLEAG